MHMTKDYKLQINVVKKLYEYQQNWKKNCVSSVQ
jgi:hypothetical protein